MKDLFNLDGKTALITGASSGIGKAIAEALGAYGATVLISSVDVSECTNTVSEFKSKDIHAFALPCDLTDKEQIDSLFENIDKNHTSVDILVSCVGVAFPGGLFEINSEHFEKTMQLNIQSAIYLTKKVVPGMQKNKDGAIIYLSSLSSVRGNKHLGLYGISKAGLTQLARNIAVEYGPDNIRANSISPGVIDTEFAKPMTQNAEVMAKRTALTPLRRVGTVDEVAGVALMLASKAGGFITGQNIIIDGGTIIGDGN